MSCLGVLFSIDQKTVDLLTQLTSDEERVDYVKEFIEPDYFDNEPQWLAELDKSWDALHRSLTDGEIDWGNGKFPLNHVVFGGTVLSDGDYIIVLKTKEQVVEIAQAVRQMTEEKLHRGYLLIQAKDYDGSISKEDFNDTWQWFEGSKEFWQKAANENRSVLFTVDQ
jgi:hypothetical protein